MTLKYFEGFDLHTRITGYNGFIVANTDSFHNWSTGVFAYWRPSFPSGYFRGGAMRVSENAHGKNEASPDSQQNIRVGFWGRVHQRGGSAPSTLCVFSPGNQLNADRAEVRILGDGTLRLRAGDSGYVGDPSAVGMDSDIFHYFEIYAESATGVVRVWRNGILILDGTVGPLTGPFNYWGIGRQNSTLQFPFWDAVIDHLWMTDGDPLPNQSVLGVSISAAQDRFDASIRGFRGTLMMGGERYITNWKRSEATSKSEADRNICSVTPFFFFNDPRDGSAWTTSKYNDIDSWGVCFAPTDAPEGNYARLDGLLINRLIYNDGMPLVVYEQPGSTVERSGNWVKSNPELAFFAHVNDAPREDILMREDSKSLYTDTVGCILFHRDPEGPEGEDAPIETIGITFAEEFRIDYKDFLRVDSVGTDFKSYAVSGYGVYGDGNRQFQGNYVTINYENTSNGQAYVQGLWDYTLDPDTGRWSMKQLVYHLDASGHKHFHRKVKIRGHGKALQIRIESQSGKPFIINGWTIAVSANQRP